MAKKKSKHTGAKVALGIGAGLAIAGAAGAAWLYGTDKGKQTKKKLESWMLKAKGEVMEKIERMDDVTEKAYHKAVADVMKKYKKAKNVSTPKVVKLEKELKKHWKSLAKKVKKPAKKKVAKKKKKAKRKVSKKKRK